MDWLAFHILDPLSLYVSTIVRFAFIIAISWLMLEKYTSDPKKKTQRLVFFTTCLSLSSMTVSCATLTDSLAQVIQQHHRVLPRDARIRHGLAIHKALGPTCRNVLAPLLQMRLDHDPHNRIPGHHRVGHLLGQIFGHNHLARKDLGAVTMAAVDHDAGRQLGCRQLVRHGLDVLLGIVRALGPTPEDDVARVVALGRDNGRKPLLGDGKEVVARRGGLDGIEGDTDTAVGAVLEPDGDRESGGKLAMDLGLSGACADCAPGYEVANILGRDGVEELAACRDTHFVLREGGIEDKQKDGNEGQCDSSTLQV